MARKTVEQIGQECFKVRIVIPGACIHAISRTEPRVLVDGAGRVAGLQWDPILDTPHGDNIPFIRWADVSAVTWRRT